MRWSLQVFSCTRQVAISESIVTFNNFKCSSKDTSVASPTTYAQRALQIETSTSIGGERAVDDVVAVIQARWFKNLTSVDKCTESSSGQLKTSRQINVSKADKSNIFRQCAEIKQTISTSNRYWTSLIWTIETVLLLMLTGDLLQNIMS